MTPSLLLPIVPWKRLPALGLLLFASTALASGDFYEQPLQTLSDYLRRDQLPAKSIGRIHEELSKPGAAPVEINFARELLALTGKSGPEALAALDRMIAVARAQANNPLLSVLHDIHDLFSGLASPNEIEAYVEWRIEQADEFGANLDQTQQPKTPKPDDQVERIKPPDRELVADIERHLAKASPALKPHWLYLRGAVEYRAAQIAQSQPWFSKVTTDFPQSPRAEAALLMAVRCQVWRTRRPEYTQRDVKLVAAERPAAQLLVDEYFAKYPHGRFFGDILGWAGALAFDGHDFGTALRYYAQQLDLPDHPELADMAAQMVERTLSHIASEPNDQAFAEVAAYPQAAQALLYLIINTSESDNYNRKRDAIGEVRGWRKNALPRLAAAISARATLYQSAAWKPRYLAMLAYAASDAGSQEQALRLLESAGPAAEQSDDLLLARAVALHRARRPAEAAEALESLLDKVPQSPLAKGARLRLGLALADDHRAGEAVLVLHPLLPVPPPAGQKPAAADAPDAEGKLNPDDEVADDTGEYPIIYPVDIDQVRALIDTLLNFAPIEELAAAARRAGLDPIRRLEFTEAIAERLLAREQFDEARKYLTPAQFGLVAAPLEKLTQTVREAKDPTALAAACLALGDAWAAQRGQLLTYPLDTTEHRREVYIDFAADANLRRADAAPLVATGGDYHSELESRDELRHAFHWWLEAADARPGTPQTAQALWRALRAMPRIADVSPYAVQRAAAQKWGEVARKLCDRLRRECPDSVEAQRYAVAWDFPLGKKNEPREGHIFRDAAGGRFPGSNVLEIFEGYDGGFAGEDQLKAEVAALEIAAAGVDLDETRRKVEALRPRVRQAYTTQYGAGWVNLVDDLALFLSEPDPDAAVRQRYAALRFQFLNRSVIGGAFPIGGAGDDPDGKLQDAIKDALADPATKPVADYFEFLRLAVIANHFTSIDLNPHPKKPEDENAEGENSKEVDTYTTRDYPQLEKAARAFLEKFPQSKKREAAMLLYARAVFRASEEIALRKVVMWPQGARWEGGTEFRLTQQEPFDAGRVLGALEAYDRAFPQGLYAPDIRACRAAVALRQHDWKTAVDLLIAQLTGDANRGLNEEAANRLGILFAQLADERYRVDILAAIKENPSAQELLEKYLDAEADTHPLLYMKSWLREQLATK